MQVSLGLTSSKEDVNDGIENYDIVKQIGRGSRSTVQLAVCKRGRLRNRKVAIKEFLAQVDNTANDSTTPCSIHQALHHPSILSCFSTFSTLTKYYYVLEYCAHGSLAELLTSRHSDVLDESEIRGLVRNLLDALLYLQKNQVVHGDISSKNIFVTEDYRVKLGNFSAAEISNRIFPGSSSSSSLNFFPDIRAVGRLILTYVGCKMPPESGEFQNQDEAIPGSVSIELRDFVSELLSTDFGSLQSLQTHPFLDPSLPTRSLGSDTAQCSIYSTRSENETNLRTTSLSWSRQALTKDIPRQPKDFIGSKNILNDASNLPQRLRAEVQPTHFKPVGTVQLPTRRVVSDPTTGTNARRKFLDGEPVRVRFRSRSVVATPSFLSGLAKDSPIVSRRAELVPEEIGVDSELLSEFEEALLSPPGCPRSSTPRRGLKPPLFAFIGEGLVKHPVYNEFHPSAQVRSAEAKPLVHTVPIGVIRPTRLSTLLLEPQTHKLNRGQLTVLPSRSLLVDFREGERRQGRTGSEVLLVSPQGLEIKAFSAPHLSSPCCLAEPFAVYSLEKLPSVYWKQYNDAHHIVEQIKQHVPKLVIYEDGVKCTLMANRPEADIELLFYKFSHQIVNRFSSKKDQTKLESRDTHMRVRLIRNRQLLEISKQVKSEIIVGGDVQGREWQKKILVVPGGNLSGIDQKLLDAEEVAGLARAIAFTSICDSIERQVEVTPSCGDAASSQPQIPTIIIDSPCLPNDSSSEFANAMSHLGESPQIPHFSSLEREVKQYSQSMNTSCGGFDTRFIPSVGWCVRYGSSFGAGRYKMMFFDGVILEVDVDGECVEFVNSGTEEVVRYDIRDCGSKRNVMDKMKAFKEFVSLFDDSSDSIRHHNT